jgi:iron complex transport system substrate-binding protein
MKQKQLTVLGLIILSFSFAGCSQKNKQEAVPNTSTAAAPSFNRIISAAPSNTEIIVGLGMGDRLIAIDRYSKDIPGVRQDLPEIDFFNPDAEAIIGFEPDLIIANEINNFGTSDSPFTLLGQMGITVLQIPTSTSIEGIYGDILQIAKTLGVEEKGNEIVSSMKDEVKRITDKSSTITAKKSIYFEISPAPYMVTFGGGAYLNEIIELIGGTNIFASEQGWFTPNAEAIINRNPDVIITTAYPGADPAVELKSRQGFETINAIKQNRIYSIEANPASRPSQHVITALKQMALAVYPEIYETN